MIPGERLSSVPVPSRFIGGRAYSVTRYTDYESGGVALQDTSQGLESHIWRLRLMGRDVVLDRDAVAPAVLFSADGITEVSLAFDQNMRPVVAFVQNGQARLWWYDSAVNQQVFTTLPSGITTPRVTLDDKTPGGIPTSDVLLFYIRAGALYYRQQRDRYGIERLLKSGPVKPLVKVGMNAGRRVQLQLRA